jgi:hypothetical protein
VKLPISLRLVHLVVGDADQAIDEFTSSFDAALTSGDLTTIVAKVEAVGPSGYVTDLSLLENRFQFQRYLSRDK